MKLHGGLPWPCLVSLVFPDFIFFFPGVSCSHLWSVLLLDLGFISCLLPCVFCLHAPLLISFTCVSLTPLPVCIYSPGFPFVLFQVVCSAMLPLFVLYFLVLLYLGFSPYLLFWFVFFAYPASPQRLVLPFHTFSFNFEFLLLPPLVVSLSWAVLLHNHGPKRLVVMTGAPHKQDWKSRLQEAV